VRVGPERGRGAGVAQCPLDGDHVTACSDQSAGEEVAQVVQSDISKSGLLSGTTPTVAHGVLVRRVFPRPLKEPTVRVVVRQVLVDVPRDHGHQRLGDVHDALASVLRCADLELVPARALNLPAYSQ